MLQYTGLSSLKESWANIEIYIKILFFTVNAKKTDYWYQ